MHIAREEEIRTVTDAMDIDSEDNQSASKSMEKVQLRPGWLDNFDYSASRRYYLLISEP